MIQKKKMSEDEIKDFLNKYDRFVFETELIVDMEIPYLDKILNSNADKPDLFLRRQLFQANDLDVFKQIFGEHAYLYDGEIKTYLLTDNNVDFIFSFGNDVKKIELIIPEGMSQSKVNKAVENFMEDYFENVTKKHIETNSPLIKQLQAAISQKRPKP